MKEHTTNPPTTPGREFFRRQVSLLKVGTTDDLIETQYCDDATLVTFKQTVKGADALKRYFREYLTKLGSIELKSTDNFIETNDTIFLEATVQTRLGEARVYDAFVLRDGKISHHFTGTK